MCVAPSVATHGAATPTVKVPPVPLPTGIRMLVTRAKSLVVVSVVLPRWGSRFSLIVVPLASLPVTTAVPASQSAWLDRTSVMRREGRARGSPTRR